MNDSTANHSSHVFDQNCTICTGGQQNLIKVKEEEEEEEDTEREYHDSPPSRSPDRMEYSPDSISRPYVTPPITSLQPLWRGNVTMHSMATFSALAYHVSGRIQGLGEVGDMI